MKYIEKLDIQTEEVKEVENLEKHSIINDTFSVNKYNGHNREFLPIGAEYDDGYKEVNETVDFGISCNVSKEVHNIKKSLDNKANLERLNDIYINVKDFICDDGEYVKGDGLHNDTSGIQKAMNYVSSLKCGTLLFPTGVYLIDKLELKPYVSIKGHGMNSTVIKANTSNNNGLFILKSTPLQMVQYEDFSIIGNNI